MARVSHSADRRCIKLAIGQRLKALRLERAGLEDYTAFTKRMGIPTRTWYNYENGASTPAEVILRVIEATNVEPMWLLYGTEPKYRSPDWPPVNLDPETAVPLLIRAALELLVVEAAAHQKELGLW